MENKVYILEFNNTGKKIIVVSSYKIFELRLLVEGFVEQAMARGMHSFSVFGRTINIEDIFNYELIDNLKKVNNIDSYKALFKDLSKSANYNFSIFEMEDYIMNNCYYVGYSEHEYMIEPMQSAIISRIQKSGSDAEEFIEEILEEDVFDNSLV